MRRPVAALAALLVLALLAGCASIPRSGAVTQGLRAQPEETLPLDVLVDGPQKDATQQQILLQFIEAAASPRGDYQTAREYLTPEFAAEWEPGAGALVYGDRDDPVAVGERALRVAVQPTAELAGDGTYQPVTSSASVSYDYTFEQVRGQWRIASAPPGLLVDERLFATVFRSYALWFYDPTFRYLVPDLRWFAARESVQTAVVRALLAGPAEWLDPGVVSAFPDGLQLEVEAVPVSASTARVSLVGAVPDDRLSRQRMQYQLAQTLDGVRTVEDIELVLNGEFENGPELATPPDPEPRIDSRPVVYDGTAFGYLSASGSEVVPIEGVTGPVVELAPTGAAVGPNGSIVAVRAEAGGVYAVRRGLDPEPLDPRTGLAVPSIDGFGYTWSVPTDAPDQLAWYASLDVNAQIGVPWAGQRVAAIEVSRDSSRIAALIQEGGRASLVVTSIARDAEGTPVELGTVASTLAVVTGEARDLAWLDSQTIAILVADDAGGTRVIEQRVGGPGESGAGPADGRQVDGANAVRDLRALTEDGDLVLRAGVGWQTRASGIRFIAAQQPD